MIGSHRRPRELSRASGRSLSTHSQYHSTRIAGSDATELFIACRPDLRRRGGLPEQMRSLYEGILEALDTGGASPGHVVSERLFLRDAAAGKSALDALKGNENFFPWPQYVPASILLEEPPVEDEVFCEAQLQVVIPAGGRSARWWTFGSHQTESASANAPAVGRVLSLDGRKHLWIGNVLGQPEGDLFHEALTMFEKAEDILAGQDVPFAKVARTWIHFAEMERDYGELNRARRSFFARAGVDLRPASTGIGGAVAGGRHRLSMCVYAVSSREPIPVEPMHTLTLNEAAEYGSDFSRGMSVEEGGRRTLHISGTASVDEAGRTVHVGDFEAQVERMLLNVEGLLENDGAGYEHLVSAITYLKDPATASRFRAALAHRGFPEVPHSIVKAEVCRPELLCEMEAIAVVPGRRQG